MFELKHRVKKQNKMSNAVTKRQEVKMPELSVIFLLLPKKCKCQTAKRLNMV